MLFRSTTHIPTVYHTFANGGKYKVILEVRASVNSAVIFDSMSDSITIHPTPETHFITDPVCLNQVSLFNETSVTYGENITKWNWRFGSKATDTSSLQNPKHKYDTAGKYNVRLVEMNRFGCSDSVTIQTRVFKLPVAGYSSTGACSGHTAIFTDKSTPADTTLGFWRWFFDDTGSSQDSSNLQNPRHSYPDTINYPVRMIVQDHFGCSDTVDSTITVRQSPVAAFTLTENINDTPGKIRLNNESSYKKYYHWDFGNGKGTDVEENPIVQYSKDGLFTINLIVVDSNGCADTTSLDYEFLFDNLYVPNAFSPTSLISTAKGLEIRKFQPKGMNLKEYHVMIFDKWGHMVWESQLLTDDGKGMPLEGWDGTFNGEPLPQDVYMWKISATFISGKVWEGSNTGKGSTTTMGTVTLIR